MIFSYLFFRNGVVRYESVIALRTKLDELGKMEGIARAKKSNFQTLMVCSMHILFHHNLMHLLLPDPEEFLNMLFKHTLKVDPFLTIRFVVENASFSGS